jgi:hypothetical protein
MQFLIDAPPRAWERSRFFGGPLPDIFLT